MNHSNIFNFFYQLHLTYFNDFQNHNFSVLWLKWTQTMEMKKKSDFFHRTYSNMTSYRFLTKNIEVFHWLSKSKFLSYMTNVNPNIGSGTKIWHHFSLVIKCYNISMTFIIGIFQFYWKSDHRHVKWIKIEKVWYFSLFTKQYTI